MAVAWILERPDSRGGELRDQVSPRRCFRSNSWWPTSARRRLARLGVGHRRDPRVRARRGGYRAATDRHRARSVVLGPQAGEATACTLRVLPPNRR